MRMMMMKLSKAPLREAEELHKTHLGHSPANASVSWKRDLGSLVMVCFQASGFQREIPPQQSNKGLHLHASLHVHARPSRARSASSLHCWKDPSAQPSAQHSSRDDGAFI